MIIVNHLEICIKSFRTLKQEQGESFEVHCSRERSRAAWKIIEEVLGSKCAWSFLYTALLEWIVDVLLYCCVTNINFQWLVQYLMPFVDKERYQLSRRCRLHPDNDLYRDQEQHKIRVDINEWKCEYCKKSFYEETYLDKHFDNRHYNLLNVVSHDYPLFTCYFLYRWFLWP